jgi:hypothetical protein
MPKNYPPKQRNTLKKSPENAEKLSTEAAKRTSKSRPKMPKNYPPKQRNTLKKSDERAKELSTGQKKGTKKTVAPNENVL